MFYMFPYPISKKNAEILAFFGAYSIGPPPNSRHPKTIKSADGGTLGSMKCSYSLSSSLEAQTVFFRGFEGEVTGIGGGCIPVFFLCRVDLCIYIYLFIYIYKRLVFGRLKKFHVFFLLVFFCYPMLVFPLYSCLLIGVIFDPGWTSRIRLFGFALLMTPSRIPWEASPFLPSLKLT